MTIRTELALHSFGDVPEDLVEEMVPVLRDRFQMKAKIGASLPVPQLAYDNERDQYRSTRFLTDLQDSFADDHDIHLGVTTLDLFVPELNFVFGEASPATWTAVFSTARLAEHGVGEEEAFEALKKRARIEAVHELGHVVGLKHCKNPKCVMWFSNRLEETDNKGDEFCKEHQSELSVTLQKMPTSFSRDGIHLL